MASLVKRFEWLWLAPIVAVPLFMRPDLTKSFEAPKLGLLLILALVVVVGVIRSFAPELPLFWPCVAILGSYIVSSCLSVNPLMSWVGIAERSGGAVTMAAFLVVFGAISLKASPSSIDHLVLAIVGTSVPIVGYAIAQRFGFDPVPWNEAFGQRVFSTAGSPGFLGDYLVLVMPLTALIFYQNGRSLLSESSTKYSILCLVWGILLAAQAFALYLTDSRAAVLSLVLGAAAHALYLMRHLDMEWSAIVALPAICAVIWLVQARPASNHSRQLIWTAVSEAVWAAPPLRLWVGFGPDTLQQVVQQSEEMRVLEGGVNGRALDRAHNAVLDSLATRGVLGLLADAALIVGVLGLLLTHSPTPLTLALAVALLAHFLDSQLGPQSLTSQFYSWCYVGMLAVLCRPALVAHIPSAHIPVNAKQLSKPKARRRAA